MPYQEPPSIKYPDFQRRKIIENKIFRPVKYTIIYSPIQMAKKSCKMVCCAKSEQKTSPYPP